MAEYSNIKCIVVLFVVYFMLKEDFCYCYVTGAYILFSLSLKLNVIDHPCLNDCWLFQLIYAISFLEDLNISECVLYMIVFALLSIKWVDIWSIYTRVWFELQFCQKLRWTVSVGTAIPVGIFLMILTLKDTFGII